MSTDLNNVISLASYRAKPVIVDYSSFFLLACELDENGGLTFATALNVPDSEDMGPGNAAEVFCPQFFACRMSDSGRSCIHYGHEICAHIRCETLRMCSSPSGDGVWPDLSHEAWWRAKHLLDCYTHIDAVVYSDDSDDSDAEPDTLNSELLLTQEFEPPVNRSTSPGGCKPIVGRNTD